MITSVRNPAVAGVARLHRKRHRRAAGQTVIEGPEIIAEAVANGIALAALFALAGDDVGQRLGIEAGVAAIEVADHVLAHISGTDSPRGPVAVMDIPETESVGSGRQLVTLGVSDPGNCGTLIRTAAAFGYGYVAGLGSADLWSPKVLRSAAGGHFHTAVSVITSLDELAGHTLVATVPSGGKPAALLPPDAAVLIGSEAHGLAAEVVAAADLQVSIPMLGPTDSLNAAVAGAIVAYLGAMEGGD